MRWTRFSHGDLHRLLISQCVSPQYRSGEWVAGQGLFCPYYVPLEGRLGADWGVIVNPESSRYAQLTFEHDDCGCPDRVDRGEGPVHVNTPSQQGDTWDVDWQHECNAFCEQPCEWQAETQTSGTAQERASGRRGARFPGEPGGPPAP